MAAAKREPPRPRRDPNRKATGAAAYALWLRRHPALKLALAEAKRRFGDLPGVCGFGIGRKVEEKTGEYGATPKRTGGLCVTVFVRAKVDVTELTADERIPCTLLVQVPGEETGTRVRLDVVAVDRSRSESPGAQPDEVAGWPTLGALSSGRCFTCGHADVVTDTGTFPSNQGVEVGTVGVMLQQGERFHYATSAAHVFIRTTQGETAPPMNDRGVGVRDQDWLRVGSLAFFPGTIRIGQRLEDAMLFEIPATIARAPTWPTGFDGTLATPDDIDAATGDDQASGFLWVERRPGGVPKSVELPVVLDGGADGLDVDNLSYGFCWKLRFTKTRSRGGDSGGAVFLRLAGGAVRLLAFHFIRVETKVNGTVVHTSYAVDADSFLRAVIGRPGTDFNFAGTVATT